MKLSGLILSAAILAAISTGVGQAAASAIRLTGHSVEADRVVLTLNLPDGQDYQVIEHDEQMVLSLPGCGHLATPGQPMLPTANLLIALPPGAKPLSVEVRSLGIEELDESFVIKPAPMMIPLGGMHDGAPEPLARLEMEWERNREAAYRSDETFPAEAGRLTGWGSLRKYSYASVSMCPLVYHPSSGRVLRYDSAEVVVRYESSSVDRESQAGLEAQWMDTTADDRAAHCFINYDRIQDLYEPLESDGRFPREHYDFVIITTDDLLGAILTSGFLSWKAAQGYGVRVVRIADPLISDQEGVDLAEQIRNFLRQYYAAWGIQYVLLVGDYATVPMRYCYPNPNNHLNTAGNPGGPGGEVPTDYYYADLSSPDATSWDADGDGFHGEYGDDSPDLMAEVFVGRIPTNDQAWVTYALDKSVRFEQDTGAWKNNALHAGAFWYFTNENHNGQDALEGPRSLTLIESDHMAGWSISHFSEQMGLETSAYDWDPLTLVAFTAEWRDGEYAVVNWGAHGNTSSFHRKIWAVDDGDGVPENGEFTSIPILQTDSNLEDDHPSIVFGMGCLVGYPEPNPSGNLGIDLLAKPALGAAVAVLCSARSPWAPWEWPTGGIESVCYEFNRNMAAESQRLGDALYNAKCFCFQNYGMDAYPEYINLFSYNLYGDPALLRAGVAVADLPAEPWAEGDASIRLQASSPNPTGGAVRLRCYLPTASTARLEVFDVTGRRLRMLADGFEVAGWHELQWDGLGDDGATVQSGTYWVRLSHQGMSRSVGVLRVR